MKIVKFVLRIPEDLYNQARACASTDSRSINWFICEAIEKYTVSCNHNIAVRNISIEPGIDIVQQRRDNKGRFIKR